MFLGVVFILSVGSVSAASSTDDTTAPKITSSNPTNNAQNVNTNKEIKVTFSEAIKEGTMWIDLKNSSGTTIPTAKTINNNILTITPTNTLTPATKYTISLHTGSITDQSNNPLAVTSLKFTTDGTPPTINSTNPTNNSKNVNTATEIKITLSESVKSGTRFIELKKISNGAVIPINLTVSGKILTITPQTTLARGTAYQLCIHTGSITDASGNPIELTSLKFTTDGTKPIITSSNPNNNAKNINTNKTIKITFSEPIKEGTMWIDLLKTGTTTKIPAKLKINNTTLTITPNTLLTGNTLYKVCLHTGSITDLSGNPLAVTSIQFTTVPTFTIEQIAATAEGVKNHIEIYKTLPDYADVGGCRVTIAQFLFLTTTAVTQINNNEDQLILLKEVSKPPYTYEQMTGGSLSSAEYVDFAHRIIEYMNENKQAPPYGLISLGQISYQSQIYLFSRVMDIYGDQLSMPTSIDIKPWYIVTNSFKIDIVIGGTGGDVTNNYLINAYISKTEETSKVVSAALSGTPMLTFGDGTGPKVLIVAGVHGNELPATIAAVQLTNYLNGKSLRGTVYIIPFAIPHNSATTSRYWQGQNPNSVANLPGTPTNQIVNLAKQLHVNAIGDFHSTKPGGVPGQNAILCCRNPTYKSHNIASYISSQTGSALISSYQAGADYPGAVEDVCNLAGIPAVTCEVLSSHGSVASGSIDMSFNQMLALLKYHNII